MFSQCILVLAFLALAHNDYIKTYYRTSSVAFPAPTPTTTTVPPAPTTTINAYLQPTATPYAGSTAPALTQPVKTVSSSVVATGSYQSVQPSGTNNLLAPTKSTASVMTPVAPASFVSTPTAISNPTPLTLTSANCVITSTPIATGSLLSIPLP